MEKKFNADEFKNETKDTFDKVKSEIKDADFKAETKQATNFVKEMLFNPIDTVKAVAKENGPSLATIIVILVAIALSNVAIFIVKLFVTNGMNLSFGNKIFKIVLEMIYPMLEILFLSAMVFVFNKGSKKSLLNIISTMTVANVPLIFIGIFNVIKLIISKLIIIINPVTFALSMAQMLLVFFGIKELYEEDEEGTIFKYIAIIFLTQLFMNIVMQLFV